MIKDDVYQHHHDSSDDENMTDEAFKSTTKDMVGELIHSLKDDHVDIIYENIIDSDYKQMRSDGKVLKESYKKLLEKYRQ